MFPYMVCLLYSSRAFWSKNQYFLPLPASEPHRLPAYLSMTLTIITELCTPMFYSALGQLVLVASEFRQARYASPTGNCSTDAPYAVKNLNKIRCASECLVQTTCADFNYKNDLNECTLFLHKPHFYAFIPGCKGFKVSYYYSV